MIGGKNELIILTNLFSAYGYGFCNLSEITMLPLKLYEDASEQLIQRTN
jgi:hypothetical protein